MQFGIEKLSNKMRVSIILNGRLWNNQVLTVRKAELEVVLLWWHLRNIDSRLSWELSNIGSVNGNRSDKKSVGSGDLPHTNTWSRLLWIARLLDQDLVGYYIVLAV